MFNIKTFERAPACSDSVGIAHVNSRGRGKHLRCAVCVLCLRGAHKYPPPHIFAACHRLPTHLPWEGHTGATQTPFPELLLEYQVMHCQCVSLPVLGASPFPLPGRCRHGVAVRRKTGHSVVGMCDNCTQTCTKVQGIQRGGYWDKGRGDIKPRPKFPSSPSTNLSVPAVPILYRQGPRYMVTRAEKHLRQQIVLWVGPG